MRKRRLTTFQKTFLSYLLICLVPVAVFACALYFSTMQSLQNENAAARQYEGEALSRIVDNELDRLQKLVVQLGGTRWVKRRAFEGDVYESEFTFDRKRAIRDDLFGYVRTSSLIRTVAVVFPRHGEVYSSNGFYRMDEYLRSFSLEKGQNPLTADELLPRVALPENNGIVPGSRLGMTQGSAGALFYVEPLEYGQPMRSFLMVELDASSLKNYLDPLRSPNVAAFRLLAGGAPLLELRWQPVAEPIVNCCDSSRFPITFETLHIPASPPPLRRFLLLGLLLLFSLLLIPNLAWLLAKLSYRPLRRLVQRVSGQSASSRGDAEDEYQLLENSLRGLTEERENVLRQAEQYRSTARENFLRRLLQGYFDEPGVFQKLQEFNIDFSDSNTHVVILLESRLRKPGGASGAGRLRPAEEVLADLDCAYETAEISRVRLAVILSLSREQKKAFHSRELAERLADSYREQAGDTPLVSVGTAEPGILGISKSYYSAGEELLALLGEGGRHVTLRRACYYPTEWEIQFINHLKAGQSDLAFVILHEIRAENEKRGVSGHQTRQLVLLLAETLSKVINEFDPHPGDYSELYETVNQSADPGELWDSVSAIAERFCSAVRLRQFRSAKSGGDAGDTEQQILQYTKGNLTDPNISLKELGDRFNLSVSAVSKLFKRACGINFYDFVMSKRMELAVEMLAERKLSVAAVARAVGYENEYSFKRAFSRFYGTTVTEYLKKQKKVSSEPK